MLFKSLIKFGIPGSFVYCTIYQQNIWREGDERLVIEQKRTWSKFFNTIDYAYFKLTGNTVKLEEGKSIVPRFSAQCWNNKVQGAFKTVDQMVNKPSLIACKVYRKIQPYLTTNDGNKKSIQ